MPYFMRIVDGVGMHAGYLPGYPASHGCIRMPQFMAEDFFKSVQPALQLRSRIKFHARWIEQSLA